MVSEILSETIEVPLLGMITFQTLILIVIGILIVQGIALWRAARQNQKGWFWTMLILNSAGILPLIYLLFVSDGKK